MDRTPQPRTPLPPKAFDKKALVEAETWVFDLDNTLYPASSNLFAQIDVRMRGFIADYLGVAEDEAHRVQKAYFHEYGTTLRGLMTRHGMEPHAFLEHVHDIDVSPVQPSPALEAALSRLPGRKVIFTNATTAHAGRVMDRLGVGHHFEAVFDIERAGYLPKPRAEIYEKLVRDFACDPANTVMVEDIARNLAPAAALGMTTVWVKTETRWGREGGEGGHVHFETDDLVAWLTDVAGD